MKRNPKEGKVEEKENIVELTTYTCYLYFIFKRDKFRGCLLISFLKIIFIMFESSFLFFPVS